MKTGIASSFSPMFLSFSTASRCQEPAETVPLRLSAKSKLGTQICPPATNSLSSTSTSIEPTFFVFDFVTTKWRPARSFTNCRTLVKKRSS